MRPDETAAVADALARLPGRSQGLDSFTASRFVATLAAAGFVVVPAAERDAYVARAEGAEAERDAAVRRWSQLSVDLHALVLRSSAFVSGAPEVCAREAEQELTSP